MKRNNALIISEIILIAILTLFAFTFRIQYSDINALSYSLIFLVIYLLYKPILAKWYSKDVNELIYKDVAIIIPVYNEEIEIFKKCLDAIMIQSLPVSKLIIIDDNSKKDECYQYALNRFKDNNKVIVHKRKKRMGKRNAHKYALEFVTENFIGLLDSDTIIDKNAVKEAMKPFHDNNINAVCSNIRAFNRNKNLLTKLIDLRYMNAFQVDRAAYSYLDSVLCSTGMFSVYRKKILVDNLEEYTNQKFFGQKIMCGDDRKMTSYALKDGKAVFQSSCKAETLAPESPLKFMLQQIRWNRSFFRESFLVLLYHSPFRVYWYLNLIDLAFWVLAIVALIYGLLFNQSDLIRFLNIYFFGYLFIITYTRNFHYIKENLFVFLISPLFSILHLILLLPLRILALVTISNSRWLTR